MKKPIIGITLDSPVESENNKYSQFPWYALRKNYMDSVVKAGGVPICLPYDHDNIEQVTSFIDGLIIPGGDCDLHPNLYNQDILSQKIKLNEERSKFDCELFEVIKRKHMPFLGICFGMQIMNVSFGGDLIQHLPGCIPPVFRKLNSEIKGEHRNVDNYLRSGAPAISEEQFLKDGRYTKSEINHEQPHPKNAPWHSIDITKDTKLYDFAARNEQVMVNSTHHQALGKVGEELIISAIASDGVIEAIEAPGYKFMIGVQWHPEYLTTDQLDINLFKALVEACKV
jgi:putative glutamine amidotransferase